MYWVKYAMEIDIYSIDKKIRDIWLKKQNELSAIDDETKELESLIYENNISSYVKKDIQDKINSLKKEKDDIMKILENQHFYTMDFYELVAAHQQIVPKKISFMSKAKDDKQDDVVSKNYLEILKKYNINYEELEEHTKTVKKEKKNCSNCKCQEFVINIEQNLEICENCGKQEEKSYKSLSYKDITRVNLSNKYTYERRIHFKDCMNQYQGKQNATIDNKIYEDLVIQFELHGLLNGDKNALKKTRFENITKEHILLFLKETGHTKHYEDVVLIYHKMTGKKVDDISHLENQLMEDFDKISNLYDKKFKFTGKIDRKSFINTQYVLFQLLRRHKYNCKKEDFNMLKTLDRKAFHDEIVKELFETLGFNFTPIF